MTTLRTARVYDAPEPGDGTRVLVDRLWPRGIAKADAPFDTWLKEIAPSTEHLAVLVELVGSHARKA